MALYEIETNAHIMIGRVLQALIFIGCGLAIYRIMRDLASARAAWLGAIAFMAIKGHAFPFWTLINYSQLAMLITLWVIVFLQRHGVPVAAAFHACSAGGRRHGAAIDDWRSRVGSSR